MNDHRKKPRIQLAESTHSTLEARRRWLLQAGALASSVSLPLWAPGAFAQSSSTLNALPRVALIIGNSKYIPNHFERIKLGDKV